MDKILIIDDEEMIRKWLGKLLVLDGYEVFTAESGQQGLDIAFKMQEQKEPVKVAVVDIKMPGMDGIEVLMSLKESAPNIEVIIITGHGGVDSVIDALRIGAFDYITKPIEYDELALVISRALEKKELIVQRKDAEERAQKSKQEVEEINKELQARIRDLERFNKVTMGRELKIIELKERIKELDETGGELKIED